MVELTDQELEKAPVFVNFSRREQGLELLNQREGQPGRVALIDRVGTDGRSQAVKGSLRAPLLDLHRPLPKHGPGLPSVWLPQHRVRQMYWVEKRTFLDPILS